MNDVYSAPKADLATSQKLEFTFSSLGFWRKLFLVLNWLYTILLTPAFFYIAATEVDVVILPPFNGHPTLG